ncbi:MAG: hypothetical protein JWN12_557 [Candidatus Saccharibacteria bacterium]|nr:hypothetical protein [Candidatus Saccharibacteria bacterium]
MGIHFKQGFTIIETMLVLAVTGVLIATLLVGTGSSINAQRYKDSVTTLTATLQAQYSQVNNVTNVRDTNGTCGSTAIPVDNASGVAPGQSDCVLMGRYVSIVNDTINAASILGYKKSGITATNDITDITTNYQLGISTSSVTTTTLEWGASIAWPKNGGEDDAPAAVSPTPPQRAISILIVRSPISGTSYTFTSDTVYDINTITSANLTAMMVANTATVPGQMQRYLCVDPSPGSTIVTVPEKLSVVIDQSAGDASAIEMRSDAVTASLGGKTKCQ